MSWEYFSFYQKVRNCSENDRSKGNKSVRRGPTGRIWTISASKYIVIVTNYNLQHEMKMQESILIQIRKQKRKNVFLKAGHSLIHAGKNDRTGKSSLSEHEI